MHLSVPIVFVAGLLAFFSPCVVPLLPSFISLVTGKSLLDAKESGELKMLQVLIPIALFCLGFSVIFIVLGTSVSLLGQWLLGYRRVLEAAAGLLLVLFGLHMLGFLRIKALYYHKQLSYHSKVGGMLAPFFIGMVFGLGWTPCVGPILSGVLVLASQANTVWQGMALLTVFSAGLSIPFMVLGLLINRIIGIMPVINRYTRITGFLAGGLIGAIGLWFVYRGLFL